MRTSESSHIGSRMSCQWPRQFRAWLNRARAALRCNGTGISASGRDGGARRKASSTIRTARVGAIAAEFQARDELIERIGDERR